MSKLTQREILTALLEGKKIRQKDWNKDEYIHLVGNEVLDKNNGNNNYVFYLDDDWELYTPTVTLFEALEAMKEGKIVINIDSNQTMLFAFCGNMPNVLVSLKNRIPIWIEKSFYTDKWQILEGEDNGIN